MPGFMKLYSFVEDNKHEDISGYTNTEHHTFLKITLKRKEIKKADSYL